MMMEPTPPPKAAGLDARHRALLLIWSAMLLSLGLYAGLAAFARPGGGGGEGAAAAVLLVFGTVAVFASCVAKQRLLSRAVGEQRPELVTTAYVVGFVLCEAAGVAGLVAAFVAGGELFYLLFIASGVGLLLHFPRRDDLLAAAYDEARPTITGR